MVQWFKYGMLLVLLCAGLDSTAKKRAIDSLLIKALHQQPGAPDSTEFFLKAFIAQKPTKHKKHYMGVYLLAEYYAKHDLPDSAYNYYKLFLSIKHPNFYSVGAIQKTGAFDVTLDVYEAIVPMLIAKGDYSTASDYFGKMKGYYQYVMCGTDYRIARFNRAMMLADICLGLGLKDSANRIVLPFVFSDVNADALLLRLLQTYTQEQIVDEAMKAYGAVQAGSAGKPAQIDDPYYVVMWGTKVYLPVVVTADTEDDKKTIALAFNDTRFYYKILRLKYALQNN